MSYIYKICMTTRALNHLHRVRPWHHPRLRHIPGRCHSDPRHIHRHHRSLRIRHHSVHTDSDCDSSSRTSSSNDYSTTSNRNTTWIHHLRTVNQNTTSRLCSTTSSWRNSSSQRCYSYTMRSVTNFAWSCCPRSRSMTNFFSLKRAALLPARLPPLPFLRLLAPLLSSPLPAP